MRISFREKGGLLEGLGALHPLPRPGFGMDLNNPVKADRQIYHLLSIPPDNSQLCELRIDYLIEDG